MLPRLAQRGIDVRALSYRTTEGDCAVAADLRAAGVPTEEVDATGLTPMASYDRLHTAVVAARPDVLVADHVLPAFTAGVPSMALPIVMVLRGETEWYDHLLERFVVANDMRVAAVVAVSRELEAKVVRLSRGTSIEILRCASGSIIPAETARWRARPFRVVYIGRLDDQQKRIHAILDTLIAASRALPGVSATIYGDGPQKSQVEAKLRSEDGHAVSFGGRLAPAEVFQQLLDAQALVLLSECEGLSSAVQEAMACGLPVIARRTASGVEGVLQHEHTALVLEDDNQLRCEIERLSGSAELWHRLSMSGRELARREFDIDRAADRWFDLLTRLASRHVQASGTSDPGANSTPYIRYLLGKPQLDRYEATVVVEHDSSGQLTRELATDTTRDWEIRRTILYRGIERGVLTADDVQSIARGLASEARDCPARLPDHAYRLASLWRLAGKTDEATRIFTDIAKRSSEPHLQTGSLYHLAALAHAAGRDTDALMYVQACLDIQPSHRAAHTLRQQLTGISPTAA